MENERFGLIAAKLHNMLGGKPIKQPSDFFKSVEPVKQGKPDNRSQAQRIYDTLMLWCGGKK
jgi:hypothetical protein